MSLVSGIYQNVEDIFAWLSSLLNQNALSYCDLETADSNHSLVSKDGSLISVVCLQGYKRFVGSNEFSYLCEQLIEMLQPTLSSPGHHIQFSFSFDESHIEESLEKALMPAKRTAQRLQLNIDDLFRSKINTMSKYCADEDCFIVLWTTPGCLEKAHFKRLMKKHTQSFSKQNLPRMSRMQNLFATIPEIRNIHQSFISTVLEDLDHAGFYASLLTAHQAVYQARKSVAPTVTSNNWSPFLPGDKLPLREEKYASRQPDISDLMWPPLEEQIFPQEGKNIGLKYTQIGDLIYAPLFIELFPKDIKPFYELFRRLLQSDMPWRISYALSPNGIALSKSKNMIAQFLTFSSHHNKLIADANRLLKELHERSDNPVIKLFVCLSTWAPKDQMSLLQERSTRLIKATQNWGGCEPRDISGDSFATTLCSAVAITNKTIGTCAAAPLSEAIKMLPFVRPASPWQQGALSFRTPDGKLWPYQPGSNQQISWIDLVYARSGSGKSVLLNTINLGLCLSPGLTQLPRISIIDIGPSSKGFISLIQEGLPQEKKHLARYYRLSMNEKDAINPFDTPLGLRMPTKPQQAFILNFLSLLLVDDISERPPEGMSSMLAMIIEQTYHRFSDQQQPKVYVANSAPLLEEKRQQLKLCTDQPDKLTWWQLADAFFTAGAYQYALMAQRYAMPTLVDTISAVHHHSIKDLFGEVKTTSEESYVDAYSRIMSGVIRNYPTLTCISKLDLTDARIIALDLDEVAKSGSIEAQKQTAMMYMLARHVMVKDYFLNGNDIEKFPAMYQDFHRARSKEIMEEPKRLVFDEFHRTANSPAVRDQVVQDMREGRKWKIHIALSSQSLKDFDPLMIEFATSTFILDSGSSVAIEETCKTFGLTETEKAALSTRVHGPRSTGATFIAQFVTTRGLNTQLLTSTISPVELWAFSTTSEDVLIRDALYDRIGPIAARKLLSLRFPSGTATKSIETELKIDSHRTVSDICNEFIETLTEQYLKEERRLLFEQRLNQLAEGNTDG